MFFKILKRFFKLKLQEIWEVLKILPIVLGSIAGFGVMILLALDLLGWATYKILVLTHLASTTHIIKPFLLVFAWDYVGLGVFGVFGFFVLAFIAIVVVSPIMVVIKFIMWLYDNWQKAKAQIEDEEEQRGAIE